MSAATTSGKSKTTGKVQPSRPPAHAAAAHQTANGSVMKKNNGNTAAKTNPGSSNALVQPKLTVGKPNDSFEQQADAMADKVVKMSAQDIAHAASKRKRNPQQSFTRDSARRLSLQRNPGQNTPIQRTASGEKSKVQSKTEEKISKAAGENVQKLSEVDKQKKIEKIEKKPDEKLQKAAEEKVQKLSEVDKQKKIEKIEKKPDEKLQKATEEKVQKLSEVDKQKKIEKIEKKPDEKLQKSAEEKVQKLSEADKQKKIEKIEKKPDEKLQKKEEEKIQKAESEKKKGGEEKILKKAEEKIQKAPLPPVLKMQEKVAAKPVAAPAPPVLKKDEDKLRKADEKINKSGEKKGEEKIQRSAEKMIQPFAEKAQAKSAVVQAKPVQLKEEEKLRSKEAEKPKAEERVMKKADEKVQKAADPKIQAAPAHPAVSFSSMVSVQKKEEEKIKKKQEEPVRKKEGEQAKTQEDKVHKAAEPKIQAMPFTAAVALKRKEDEKVQKAADEKVQKVADEKVQKAADEKVQKATEEKVQKANEHQEEQISPAFEAKLQGALSGGAPMDRNLKAWMEARFEVDFSAVRMHTDALAAQLCTEIGAQAFAYKNHVFFNRGKYQPNTETGRFLIAHELTHVIQQGYAHGDENAVQRAPEIPAAKTDEKVQKAADEKVQKAADEKVQKVKGISQTGARIQRLGLSDILDGLAALAANIPGFTLLTVIIGRNPINMAEVDRSPVNILRGFMGLIPGGEILFQVLNSYNVAARIASWIGAQVESMGISFSSLRDAFTRFTDSLSWSDIFSPGDVWRRARDIFTPIITRIVNFVAALIAQAIAWLKETFMQPLSDFCRQIPGYGLVTVLLGRDPFTNAAVPRTAMNVVKAFAEFIPGGTEKVQQLEESKGLQKAYEWFISETQARNLTWDRIAGTFQTAWDTLKLEDVLSPIQTLRRIAGIFSPLFNDLVGFAGAALMKLLEFIYEAVMGAGGALVLSIIKKSAATFKTIIQNPVGFLSNLVRAIGMGIRQFAGNILRHLQTGVITWLTGTLTKAGVELPAQWDLKGILKLIMGILGITWPRIRAIAVDVFGARVVDTVEKIAGFIMDIKEKGFIQTVKDRINQFFSGLKEMVLGKIKSFIQERIVMAGIAQLVSLLSPVGAVIQAIIKTYQTVMFFVQKINQILQFVNSIVDSIAAIAAGSLGAAANYVEQTMARTIPLILDFLARMIGLGDISGKIKSLIEQAQEFIAGKIRQGMEWAKAQVMRLVASATNKEGTPEQQAKLTAAINEAQSYADGHEHGLSENEATVLDSIKAKHGLKKLALVKGKYGMFQVEAEINPKKIGDGALLDKTQQKALKKVAEEFVAYLKKPGNEAYLLAFNANALAFINTQEGAKLVGDSTEALSMIQLERELKTTNPEIRILHSIRLIPTNSAGEMLDPNSHQNELDFIALGANRVIKVISAKANQRRVDLPRDRTMMNIIKGFPLHSSPENMRNYCVTHLAYGKAEPVYGAVIKYNEDSDTKTMPVSTFNSTYMAKTTVEQITFEGKALNPDDPTERLRANVTSLGITKSALMPIVIEYVRRRL